MNPSKDLKDNLDDYNKLLLDLANCNEKSNDDNVAFVLFNSLLDVYKEVKIALKNGRTLINYEEIITTLRSKDLELMFENNGKGLTVRGRSTNKNSNNYKKSKRKSRSKSQVRGKSCYYSYKEGHLVKDCYKIKNK